MSDVPDWSNVSANYVREVANQNLANGQVQFDVDLIATDRSLVFLTTGLSSTVTVTVKGNTSGVTYTPTDVIPNVTGRAYQVPCYGLIDATAQVTVNATDASDQVWVLATPDQSLAGDEANGLIVSNLHGQAVQVVQSTASGEQGASAVATTAGAQLLAAPIAGAMNVVDWITLSQQSAAAVFFLRLNSGSGTTIAELTLPATASANPVLPGPLYLTTSLWVVTNVAVGLAVVAAYHTVNLPN